MDGPWTFLAGHALAVYTTTWCPDCRRLKDLLKKEGVAFTDVNIEDDSAASDRLVSETGKRAIPYILVDDRMWVRGYHLESPNRLDRAILMAELRAATGNA